MPGCELTGGGSEVKAVGRVSPHQVETRSSQRSKDQSRTDPQIKVRPSGLRPETRDRLNSFKYRNTALPEDQENSWMTRRQIEQSFDPAADDQASDSGKSPVDVKDHRALRKVHVTPRRSSRIQFAIVTPEQEVERGLKEAGPAGCDPMSPDKGGPESQNTKTKGKCVILKEVSD